MFKLECAVQMYGWGRIGLESSVAAYKASQDENFHVQENKNYAELWMGTHSNGPSKLQINNEKTTFLSDYLKEDVKNKIGSLICQRFYESADANLSPGELPFLFKVLSINQALSIQAHPNKQLARVLHVKDPKNYPDANHKPEMLIALSEPFEAMCGFRLPQEILQHLFKYQELQNLCGSENYKEFKEQFETDPNAETQLKTILRKCFTSLMNKSEQVISENFTSLQRDLEIKLPSDRTYLEELFLRLAKQYPNDVGCFSIFLLNCLKLKCGEAIYLAANIPHAYLFGDGVECMACSDNVVRAGLTPKFKDVNVLCDMLDYTMRSSDDNKQASIAHSKFDYITEFRPNVDEFSVEQIKFETRHLNEAKKLLIPKRDSASILIVNRFGLSKGTFQTNDAKTLPVKAGWAYYLNASVDFYFEADEVLNEQDTVILLAYRAYCDIKN